ncbi:TetR family transcriptional regulator C-terminal domain-containing protein [Thermopolyspora sp. NPDC052614]|uniref:TetR family transcriptional regulator C-terminal domain-containing protein n=1 Tax=Thermopolyspora sp. NPDC052614 TaxID=3155682 RepID=UPI0034147F83
MSLAEHTLTEPDLAPDGIASANALRDFMAEKFRQAQQMGELPQDDDPPTLAAVTLALANGLQSSVLAGQYDGPTAVRLLTAHLDRLFTGA